MRLQVPTDDAGEIELAVAALMRRYWEAGRAVRLIGVRVGRLEARPEAAQLSLFEGERAPAGPAGEKASAGG
jgi:hypothetical protein